MENNRSNFDPLQSLTVSNLLAALPFISLTFGLLFIIFYAISPPQNADGVTNSNWSIFAFLLMSAFASGAIGAFIGFLFGIPRTNQPVDDENKDETNYRANTNLEDISDWLTKILVGVSLTQITSVPDYMQDLSIFLQAGMGGTTGGATFGVMTVVYFASCSFLIAYLQTRLRMAEALQVSEQRIKELLQEENSKDVHLQMLVHQLLNSDESEIEDISQEKIDRAFAEASPTSRQIVFSAAWDVRRDTWRDNKIKMERTIPIFRALVKTDPDNYTYLGNLGWALKDKRNPNTDDLQKARHYLTRAIQERGEVNRGYPHYEASRAIVNIRLDENYLSRKKSTEENQRRILNDLQQAVRFDPDWIKRIENIQEIKDWMEINNVSLSDIDPEA